MWHTKDRGFTKAHRAYIEVSGHGVVVTVAIQSADRLARMRQPIAPDTVPAIRVITAHFVVVNHLCTVHEQGVRP